MSTWAKAPAPRHQLVLISQTLDEAIAADHPIRLFDAVLLDLDWRSWEARYDGRRGQPPIHPRLVAGLILWGLMRRIRSSRDLEEATRERLDVRWFLDGRTIDHTTIAVFRTECESELKALSKQIARALVTKAGCASLVEMIIDGTRVRANSDRNGARDAAFLEKRIAELAAALQEKLKDLAREDTAEEERRGLLERIEQLQSENDKYRLALDKARERDALKRAHDGAKARAVRVPVGDPDSTILPNKEGGFAPNYTALAAVEGLSGAIVSSEIIEGGEEASALKAALGDCREIAGEPTRVLADTGFASGENLRDLEQSGIDAYMPVAGGRENPAVRADASAAVAPEQWPKLPVKGGRLSHEAFLYDRKSDTYRCPMGDVLSFAKKGKTSRTGVAWRSYVCPGKAECPLASQCVKSEKAPARTLVRDEYQDERDRTAQRMASDGGRAIYKRRAPLVEGVFATIKQAMGIRQFLLRGLGKVSMEWKWITSAYNLKKLLKILAGKGVEAAQMG